jgi:hypothetical protein
MADFLVEKFSLFSFFRCVLCICIFAFFCVKAKAQEDNPHHNVILVFANVDASLIIWNIHYQSII